MEGERKRIVPRTLSGRAGFAGMLLRMEQLTSAATKRAPWLSGTSHSISRPVQLHATTGTLRSTAAMESVFVLDWMKNIERTEPAVIDPSHLHVIKVDETWHNPTSSC